MVRINLLDPTCLTDQHLIAEYDEMLMLVRYVERYPEPVGVPERFTLNKGHMKFFKNKLLYLQARHELLKKEMRRRGFKPTKTISLRSFPKSLCNDWRPTTRDKDILRKRIREKVLLKPEWYRYYGEHKDKKFLLALLKNG